jgi:hypothetical protein
VGRRGGKEDVNPSVKAKPQVREECGPGCKERRTLWREELTSLSTLVRMVATLLVVITPSEGSETWGAAGWHPKWNHEPGMEGLMNLNHEDSEVLWYFEEIIKKLYSL